MIMKKFALLCLIFATMSYASEEVQIQRVARNKKALAKRARKRNILRRKVRRVRQQRRKRNARRIPQRRAPRRVVRRSPAVTPVARTSTPAVLPAAPSAQVVPTPRTRPSRPPRPAVRPMAPIIVSPLIRYNAPDAVHAQLMLQKPLYFHANPVFAGINIGVRAANLSLHTDQLTGAIAQRSSPYNYFLTQIPHFGHYQNTATRANRDTVGDTYNQIETMAVIEIPKEQFIFPEGVITAVANQLGLTSGTPAEKLQQIVNRVSNIQTNALILGGVGTLAEDSIYTGRPGEVRPRTYNAIYHPWAEQFTPGTGDFNIPAFMGVFNPNGIEQVRGDTVNPNGPMSFGTIDPKSIFYHTAFSPNNARIGITHTRSISTFWIVALSPDHRTLNVAHVLKVTNPLLQADIEAVLQMSTTFEDMLTGLENIPLPQGYNRDALHEYAQTLRRTTEM